MTLDIFLDCLSFIHRVEPLSEPRAPKFASLASQRALGGLLPCLLGAGVPEGCHSHLACMWVVWVQTPRACMVNALSPELFPSLSQRVLELAR